MQKIIAVILISVIAYCLYEFFNVYTVFSNATYKASFQTVGQLLSGEPFGITLVNHKNKRLSITDLTIQLVKNNVVMGGFAPTNVSLVKGENELVLTFLDNTKFLSIGTDYALNKLDNYKVRFSGMYLGFIPFKVSVDANKFL